MVARSTTGEIYLTSIVEMTFNHRANICDDTIVPARIEESVRKQAQDILRRCVKALGGVGIFGIEMFLTHDNKLLVNEIAPKTP